MLPDNEGETCRYELEFRRGTHDGRAPKRKAGHLEPGAPDDLWERGGPDGLEELRRRMQSSIDSLSRALLAGAAGAAGAGAPGPAAPRAAAGAAAGAAPRGVAALLALAGFGPPAAAPAAGPGAAAAAAPPAAAAPAPGAAAPGAAALERQLAVQRATSVAQQTQLLQQQQFYSQCRVYEAQRSARGQASGRAATRFRDGYRPMRMCKGLTKFGTCLRADDCTFAHTYDELHPASSDLQSEGAGALGALVAQQETPAFLNAEPNMQVRKKRDMCQRLIKSGCLLGKKCMFAHSEDELGTVSLVITDVRVKRQICKYWESGRCGYGNYCVNAHGMEEIGKLKPPEELCPAGQNPPATRIADAY